ncbi:Na+/H+ antiporter, partial [Bacillus vallismortis]|nr:Na+/H+ antiporter [Bacillus vallismortis]
IFFGEHKKPEMSILKEEGLIQATRVKTAKAAIAYLEKHKTEEHKEVLLSHNACYKQIIFRLEHNHHDLNASAQFEAQ